MDDESRLLTWIGLKKGTLWSLVNSSCSRNYLLKLNEVQSCPKHTRVSFALKFTIGDVAQQIYSSTFFSLIHTDNLRLQTRSECMKIQRTLATAYQYFKDLQGVITFKSLKLWFQSCWIDDTALTKNCLRGIWGSCLCFVPIVVPAFWCFLEALQRLDWYKMLRKNWKRNRKVEWLHSSLGLNMIELNQSHTTAIIAIYNIYVMIILHDFL